MRREVRLPPSARVLASSCAVTLSRPSRRARASVATSTSFCFAKASHAFNSLSSRVSRSRSIGTRSEEHTSELQSRQYLVCRLLLEKKKKKKRKITKHV